MDGSTPGPRGQGHVRQVLKRTVQSCFEWQAPVNAAALVCAPFQLSTSLSLADLHRMLSEAQVRFLRDRVNEETDLPFINEDHEGKIIKVVIDAINPRMEPALRAIIPNPYVECLKLAISETTPTKEKRTRISLILRNELEQPLAEQLAGSVDVAIVPEDVEERLMRVVAKKIIEELVEWTVGELDERMRERIKDAQPAPPDPVEQENKPQCKMS